MSSVLYTTGIPGQVFAQAHDLADDEQARSLETGRLDALRQIAQGADDHPLRRRRPLLDHRRRPLRRQPVHDQFGAQRRQRRSTR